MKILVIDDSKIHLDSAVETLKDHELTLCSSYDEAVRLLEDGWDAVLCDLLMPAGRDAQGPEGQRFVGKEMPVGWSLALVAASRGAKYVAVASDANHHDHPASAMLDRINQEVLHINRAKVLFTNHIEMIDIKSANGRGKNWAEILQRVIENDSKVKAKPGKTGVC